MLLSPLQRPDMVMSRLSRRCQNLPARSFVRCGGFVSGSRRLLLEMPGRIPPFRATSVIMVDGYATMGRTDDDHHLCLSSKSIFTSTQALRLLVIKSNLIGDSRHSFLST